MTLEQIPGEFSVCRVPDLSGVSLGAPSPPSPQMGIRYCKKGNAAKGKRGSFEKEPGRKLYTNTPLTGKTGRFVKSGRFSVFLTEETKAPLRERASLPRRIPPRNS